MVVLTIHVGYMFSYKGFGLIYITVAWSVASVFVLHLKVNIELFAEYIAFEIRCFDIGTCRGMQQVLEISDASIMKQLALDESDWSDMVAEMRKDNQSLRKERDSYKEINRILLQ
mgnify:CR=1 FL=1